MQDIKQQEEMLKRFDEKFPDELIRDGDINQWSQNDEIKRFIQSEILLAVEQERERVLAMVLKEIDKMREELDPKEDTFIFALKVKHNHVLDTLKDKLKL